MVKLRMIVEWYLRIAVLASPICVPSSAHLQVTFQESFEKDLLWFLPSFHCPPPVLQHPGSLWVPPCPQHFPLCSPMPRSSAPRLPHPLEQRRLQIQRDQDLSCHRPSAWVVSVLSQGIPCESLVFEQRQGFQQEESSSVGLVLQQCDCLLRP